MTILKQRPISFNNICGAIFDEGELKRAIFWYTTKPVCQVKKIFLFGRYPGISIYDEKIHIHRLLMMFWNKQDLEFNDVIHHIDSNRMNASRENLTLLKSSIHMYDHNANRKLSEDHRRKIGEANKKRQGIKMKKRVDIDLDLLKQYIFEGKSISKIAKIFGCDWTTIKSRIHENPELTP